MGTPTRRVWFVTGAGRGIGRAVVDAALGAGDRVVGTARRPEQLDDLVEAHPDDLLVLALDVRDAHAVAATVAAAIEWAGRLDVVVNNAGYGLVGAIEEVTPGEAQDILSTNALGPISVCRAVLPLLLTQGSGHIVQISTTGGVGAMPLLGLYNASKWALEGFSEALAAEVSGFGVRVTIAELGGFATDWAGSSMQFAAPEPAYDELRSSMFGTPTVPWPTATAGPEDDSAGEPPASVAAEALLAVVDRDDGPLRVLIGDDTPGHVAMALAARRDDYQRDTRFRWPHP